MIQLDVLAVGDLSRAEDGTVVEAHSTSTLIRASGHNIVVDPSDRYMEPAVRTSLSQIGIRPDEVDIVVLTHAHKDHSENVGMYKNAKVYIHSGSKTDIPGTIIIDAPAFSLCEGVKLIHTPGHCNEEMSVFVEADRKYVCAGDAIPLEGNLRKNVPPAINVDARLALESIKKIREYADVVIPGHGFPFMTDQ